MEIRHKGIEFGIVTDAPFLGARISAIGCEHNCAGCFNQGLRKEPFILEDHRVILSKISSNPLSYGVIFGGLEWTEQPEELLILINAALARDLKVIVYTHMSMGTFLSAFPVLRGSGIYVKTGEYKENSKPYLDKKHDIQLASANQEVQHLIGG